MTICECSHGVGIALSCQDCEMERAHRTDGIQVSQIIYNIEMIALHRNWSLYDGVYLVAPFGFCQMAFHTCKDARMEKRGTPPRNVVIVPAVSGDIELRLGTQAKTIFIMRNGDVIDVLEWHR